MESSSIAARRWIDDLVEYFRELGGEAHYSELYAYIAANPRRPLGKEWQAVVRRTIEEHSSDTTIWVRRRLPDLFRSVEGLGRGRWALRDGTTASTWTLQPGESINRSDLRTSFGGSSQGGICPSSTSPNVFLFSDPDGREHGYIFDGWRDDGCFYYTGSGQVGDQETNGVNGAVLAHVDRGRTLRLFAGSRGSVTYIGAFTLDSEQPFYRDDAPESGDGALRSVIVFRLRPAVLSNSDQTVHRAISSVAEIQDVPVEAQHAERYVITPTFTPIDAQRRETKLVLALCNFLGTYGLKTSRNKIRPPETDTIIATDIWVPELNLLVEAKGTVERNSFRLAIGQLADYRRFLKKPVCAILVPSQPASDLLDLARIENLMVIWPLGNSFIGLEEVLKGRSIAPRGSRNAN